MSDAFAVRLEDISKKYRLFGSKKERILEALHPFRKSYHREFWALKDINLEVPPGHTVGILGLNGSGKSTLLQIVSSVLRPTSGTVTVHGRVAALLELGAGLNPELTGRENVVMNGAMMGFNREVTLRRMEEIEAFSDIGEFFDQPMKTYSSGMYMRVAFASSIFVDPDILIIDEALSVGDGKFAEKCYSRIRKFRQDGKTILLVTHDRGTIPRLCDIGVLLHRGRLVEVGATKRIVDLYTEIMAFGDLSTSAAAHPNRADATAAEKTGDVPRTEVQDQIADAETDAADLDEALDLAAFFQARTADMQSNPMYNKYEHRFGNGNASIDDFCVVQGRLLNPVPVRNTRLLEIYVKVSFTNTVDRPLIGITITSSQGVVLYGTHSGWLAGSTAAALAGETRIYKFSLVPSLSPGDWFVELAVAENSVDMCDVRSKVMHLAVSSEASFDGLAHIQTEFTEVMIASHVSEEPAS